ncbi:hypothetical protein BH20GEM1_BH20GEM1_12610 [soil metagenome]
MNRLMILIGAIVLLSSAGSLAAQEADTTAQAGDPAAEAPPVEPPAMEAPAADAAVEGAAVAEEHAEHDWEFTLSATDKAPGASATVMVMDAEQGSDFVLVASGLPEIDALDEENQDVSAYTVWVVPGKDKVGESQLAGVLTVAPDGTGRLEAETSLETFGLIVTATPDAAPTQIGGVPVLTGIPVDPDAPADVVEEGQEAAENVAEEVEDVTEETDPAKIEEEAAEVSEEVSEGMEEVAEEEAEEAAQEPQTTP